MRSLRRSKLIAKGATWEVIAEANASAADIVHIELESGYPPENRAQAAATAARAIKEMDWSRKEAWVRVAYIDLPGARENLVEVMRSKPDLVYMAKPKSPEDILRLDAIVSSCEADFGIEPGSTQIGAVIERVDALNAVEAIAAASPRMGAIMFGVNDMSIDFGYRPSREAGKDYETLMIRSRMILAARLAGIDVIDAPFMNRTDLEGSEADAQFSALLGFTGKTVLSIGQIAGVHRAFSPTEKELDWARRVLEVAGEVGTTGYALGVVDGEFVDKPHFLKAERIVARAG